MLHQSKSPCIQPPQPPIRKQSFSRFLRCVVGKSECTVVHRNEDIRPNIKECLYGFLRRYMLWAHEPFWLICTYRHQCITNARKSCTDILESLEVPTITCKINR